MPKASNSYTPNVDFIGHAFHCDLSDFSKAGEIRCPISEGVLVGENEAMRKLSYSWGSAKVHSEQTVNVQTSTFIWRIEEKL